MDTRLKELLRETAEEMPVKSRMPEQLRRRIRRRRAVTAAAAGMVAVVLVAGGVLGADELLRGAPATQRPGGEVSPTGDSETPIEPSPSPSPSPDPTGQTPIEVFVEEFMQRRVDRSQAEVLLTTEAARDYEEDRANGPYLYDAGEGDWPPEFYTEFRLYSVQRLDEDRWEVTVVIEGFSFGEGDPVLFAEVLTIGPGRNQQGEDLDLMVLSATRRGGHERPQFSMSPTAGRRGTEISVSGTGAFAAFDPSHAVDLIEIRFLPDDPLATIPVNPDGTWSWIVAVPDGADSFVTYGVEAFGLLGGRPVMVYQSQRFYVEG
ncbi:MAG: hypothetical protein ACRDGU_02665 [Actinomycetota bacterium]